MATVDRPKDKKGEFPIQFFWCFRLMEGYMLDGNTSAVAQGLMEGYMLDGNTFAVARGYARLMEGYMLDGNTFAVARGYARLMKENLLGGHSAAVAQGLMKENLLGGHSAAVAQGLMKGYMLDGNTSAVAQGLMKGYMLDGNTSAVAQCEPPKYGNARPVVAILEPPASLYFGGSKFQRIEVTRSATQMFKHCNIDLVPKSYEIGSSSVAQPPPSPPSAGKTVRLGCHIPIIVIVRQRQANQQHRYIVRVEPDEQVSILRQLLASKCNVTCLPQHYSFALKREVMNEDLSFREHGIMSMGGTKIDLVDLHVYFPPHHFNVIG